MGKFQTKGMRNYQHVVNYFLVLDHERGKGYRILAREYDLPVWSIRDRIKTWNKKYYLDWNNKMNDLKLLPPDPNGPEHIPIKGYIKTFQVAVFIIDLKNNDDIIDMRVIDYGKMEDKQWLGKISFWAWNKGYSIETMRLEDAEGR